jgi:hypothetical protein
MLLAQYYLILSSLKLHILTNSIQEEEAPSIEETGPSCGEKQLCVRKQPCVSAHQTKGIKGKSGTVFRIGHGLYSRTQLVKYNRAIAQIIFNNF